VDKEIIPENGIMESAWLVVRMSITAYVLKRKIDQLGIMESAWLVVRM
jgi:hypothetical protein